jgi:hypothetical protein
MFCSDDEDSESDLEESDEEVHEKQKKPRYLEDADVYLQSA